MTDETDAAHKYFLSYSRSDERFALRLAKDLRARGVDIWVDQLDIRPSEHWDRAIERAVGDCRGLVVILSPRSVASENVADEISFAIDNRKTVLPVMIDKCVLPLRITRMHMIDATASYDKALQQCLSELTHPDRRPKPEEAAAVPAVGLNQETLAAAKRELAKILGPIAGILVDKAAARAASPKHLHDSLLQHIDGESDRTRFLASVGHTPGAAADGERAQTAAVHISANDVEAIGGVLTAYLGPIAPLVAKRESRSCVSLDDLRQRLASLIPAQRDRDAFLSQIGAR